MLEAFLCDDIILTPTWLSHKSVEIACITFFSSKMLVSFGMYVWYITGIASHA